jgi:hypothetical protein
MGRKMIFLIKYLSRAKHHAMFFGRDHVAEGKEHTGTLFNSASLRFLRAAFSSATSFFSWARRTASTGTTI